MRRFGTQARVAITLKDGTVLDAAHDLDAPMPIEERKARIEVKAAALIGEARAAQIWALIEEEASPDAMGRALCHRFLLCQILSPKAS